MSSKLTDTKHRNHASKVLKKMNKSNAPKSSPAVSVSSLEAQYNVIRSDLLKLRADLTKGYDLAKNALEKKGFVRGLLQSFLKRGHLDSSVPGRQEELCP